MLVSLGVLEPRDEQIDGTMPWLNGLLAAQPYAVTTIITRHCTTPVTR